jgi:hypothetical protein
VKVMFAQLVRNSSVLKPLVPSFTKKEITVFHVLPSKVKFRLKCEYVISDVPYQV